MKILVIKKDDLSIVHRYEADAPSQHLYGGPWGDPEQTAHVLCSPLMDSECVAAVDQEGVIVLEEDQALLDAKTERLWKELREERDLRLSECDWTQLPDSPLNLTDKAAWQAYRQELRDLPENTLDPAAPVWPSKPNEEI